MRLKGIKLQHFRNIAWADLSLEGQWQVFLGKNGQGKTNLLEALGLLTALRSFRASTLSPLLMWEQAQARIHLTLEHELQGRTEVEIQLEPKGKNVWVDGEKVARLTDFIGQFPTVVLNSEDIQLLRGSPQARRRFLDLTLSAVNRNYLQRLRAYHQALRERNQLLKQQASLGQIVAFEQVMAVEAVALMALRQEGIAALGQYLEGAYHRFCGGTEQAAIHYRPDCFCEDVPAFLERMAQQRSRDLLLKTTTQGPHRDDCVFRLFGRQAKEVGSEGQQRGLVIALRLAQANWFHRNNAVQPILLVDDVLGELDGERRERFWKTVGEGAQIIASGTELLLLPQNKRGWQVFRVDQGKISH